MVGKHNKQFLKTGAEHTTIYIHPEPKFELKVFCLKNRISIGDLLVGMWKYLNPDENPDFLIFLSKR